MKTVIYTLLAATLAFFRVGTVCAQDGDARVTQTRKVEPFHAIDITAVGNIIWHLVSRPTGDAGAAGGGVA